MVTSDIKGTQKQILNSFLNSLFVSFDVEGAQPKVNIRALNQPQYDPSN